MVRRGVSYSDWRLLMTQKLTQSDHDQLWFRTFISSALKVFLSSPRVDPDWDAPRTHVKDPRPCLHVRNEAVSSSRRRFDGAAFSWLGSSAQPPPAFPQLPKDAPEKESRGRELKELLHPTAGGCYHHSGGVEDPKHFNFFSPVMERKVGWDLSVKLRIAGHS